jgi:hypothetical protein
MTKFEWPCDRRDAHHPHEIHNEFMEECVVYQCPGVGAHPLTQIGGAHTEEEISG